MAEYDFKRAVKLKYDYLADDEVSLYILRAKSLLLENLFKSDLTIDYDNFDFSASHRYDMWILDCVDELIERNGISSAVAYKENGMSITFDNAGVSKGLLSRIPNIVGTVSYFKDEDDE